jgi:hypothetical protein
MNQLYAAYDNQGNRISDVVCLDCLMYQLKQSPLSDDECVKRVQEEEHKRCEWCADEI